MKYDEALAYIHSRKRFGPKPGLDRIRKLLSLTGDPQNNLSFVHVAGTNGKGSTATMIARVLERAGYRTGLFISPFVLDFRERFQVCGAMIPKEDLVRLTEFLRPVVDSLNEKGETVAEFELVTAIGMHWFSEQKCDIVCLEVGIGGRFDATNVISRPLAAVIGPISFDHTDLLGETISEIASEKAGIIKEKTDVVCYSEQDPEALAAIMDRCAGTGSRLVVPNRNAVKVSESTPFGSVFSYGSEEYRLRLAGPHQICNAVSAIETIRILREKGYNVPEQAVRDGLEQTSFPARFEVFSEHPLVVLDGAHNEGAALALSRTLGDLPVRKRVGIIGMLADKSWRDVLARTAPLFSSLITVDISSPRALAKEVLLEQAERLCPNCRTAQDHREALREALASVGEDGAVVIYGSLYLAAEIRDLIPSALRQYR